MVANARAVDHCLSPFLSRTGARNAFPDSVSNVQFTVNFQSFFILLPFAFLHYFPTFFHHHNQACCLRNMCSPLLFIHPCVKWAHRTWVLVFFLEILLNKIIIE